MYMYSLLTLYYNQFSSLLHIVCVFAISRCTSINHSINQCLLSSETVLKTRYSLHTHSPTSFGLHPSHARLEDGS